MNKFDTTYDEELNKHSDFPVSLEEAVALSLFLLEKYEEADDDKRWHKQSELMERVTLLLLRALPNHKELVHKDENLLNERYGELRELNYKDWNIWLRSPNPYVLYKPEE